MTNATRRSFLTAGAVAAVPFFIKAEKKSGAKLPILGEGEHSYECIHDWGELPANIKYGNTHNACEDSQGHIYIHHTVHATSQSPDAVVVFDNNGKFVRSWGAMFKGGAHGMCGATNFPGMKLERSSVARTPAGLLLFPSPRCAITLLSLSRSVTRDRKSGTTTTPLYSWKWQGERVPPMTSIGLSSSV